MLFIIVLMFICLFVFNIQMQTSQVSKHSLKNLMYVLNDIFNHYSFIIITDHRCVLSLQSSVNWRPQIGHLVPQLKGMGRGVLQNHPLKINYLFGEKQSQSKNIHFFFLCVCVCVCVCACVSVCMYVLFLFIQKSSHWFKYLRYLIYV